VTTGAIVRGALRRRLVELAGSIHGRSDARGRIGRRAGTTPRVDAGNTRGILASGRTGARRSLLGIRSRRAAPANGAVPDATGPKPTSDLSTRGRGFPAARLRLLQLVVRVGNASAGSLRSSTSRHTCAKLALDTMAVGAANLVAFVIRFEGAAPPKGWDSVAYGMPIVLVAYGLAFAALRTHRRLWRYASVEDLRQLVVAMVLGAGIHALALKLFEWRSYSVSVLLLTAILAVGLAATARLLVRSLARRSDATATAAATPRRVVIVGAGSTGESVARERGRAAALGYEFVGFVDDDPRLRGQAIRTLPVLGTTADLPYLVGRHRIQEAVIAIPTLRTSDLRRIGERCTQAGLTFKTVPSVTQLVRGEGKLRFLRKVNGEELLGRGPASLGGTRVEDFLHGKRVLVTGAGGSIGSELCRQILRLGVQSLVLVERAENALYDIDLELRELDHDGVVRTALADVRHVPRMSEIFERFRPQVAFHAAAYKHVPMLEQHPAEGVLNNVVGTRRLTRVAKALGTETFVFVSTDKAVAPKNLMGATKKLAEMYLTALDGAVVDGGQRATRMESVIVRFGNVLGSAGSVLPLFLRQVETGGPITITDPEMSRFFMTIPEAVALLLQSATMVGRGDIFVLDMGEPRKIAELAENVVAALGLCGADVGRRYVGLRPGEKMHESLWESGEHAVRSEHERIFLVRGEERRTLEEMETLIDALEVLALRGNHPALLDRIREAIPTYCPSMETPLAMAR
jgi:FlaA1/EpsC-like NDP-sugar epimerase